MGTTGVLNSKGKAYQLHTMGLSGILAGGALLAVTGLLSGLLSTFLPMWLITRLELHHHLCWTGTGLWQTNFVWGQDIPEMGLKCEGEAQNTYNLYCSAESTDFEKSMCFPTNVAKISLLASQAVGVITLFVMCQFGAKRYHSTGDYLQELWLSRILVLLSLVCCGLEATGFGVIYHSELFSAAHVREISSNYPVPFPSHEFGCEFQSPLRAKNFIKAITKSSPLNCLYGGPAFAMAATSLVAWALAALFFMVLYMDVLRLQARMEKDPSQRITPKRPIRHPVLTEVLYPRNYSLYGAISRRYEGSRWRRLAVLTLPLLTMATFVHFAIMMLLNGAAVQVFIRLSSPRFSRLEWETALQGHRAHIAEFPQSDKIDASRPQIAVIEIIEEVFDFTMLTSIKNFWDGKAYALAILTAVFCAAWPYLRVVVQLVMYFIPLPEQHRGRTFTWIDSLGKWTFVNTFVLCFMGVAFHLHSTLKFGLPMASKDFLDVDIEVSLGPRIATYMFVFGTIASILISELHLILHRKCRDWEELRNAESLAHLGQENNNDESQVRISRGGSPPSVLAAGSDAETSEEAVQARAHLENMHKKVIYQHGFGYESLCDRYHNPIQGGAKYAYSGVAKVLVWVALGFTACTTLAGMLQVSIAFDFQGLVGDIIVDAHDKIRQYSLVSIGTSIETEMGSTVLGGVFLTGVFFSVAFVAPLLRLFGLSVLWYVPMRPAQQKFWFHLMEMIESWSALDVYFVSILAATLEISELSQVILGNSFPAVEKLVEDKFPQFGGLFRIEQHLLNGMYLIFVGVFMEKLMSLFIVAQTASAIAERTAEEKLALDRNRMLPGIREESDVLRELEEHPETWAILSPAARYTSASANTSIVYSGLPRIAWLLGIRLGLMVEVVPENEEGLEGGQVRYFSLEAV